MAFALTDANKLFPCENARMLLGFKALIVCKVTVMLSRVPGIFLYLFIIRSTNCYKLARAVITALHIKDGFNYAHNIYANAR